MDNKWKLYRNYLVKYGVRNFVWAPLPVCLATASLFWALTPWPADFGEFLIYAGLYYFTINVPLYLCYAVFYALLTHAQPQSERGWKIDQGLWVHIVFMLFAVGTGVSVSEWVIRSFLRPDGPHEGTQWALSLVTGLLIGLLFTFIYGYFKSRSLAVELERDNLEAKYSSLRDQMQPHFLFNALNGLAELIEEKPRLASRMATRLSDVYRRILEASHQNTWPLFVEIGLVEDYLMLQQMRFGERLKFDVDSSLLERKLPIPCLMLQTLVENAIKHGVAPSREGGEISIWSESKEGVGDLQLFVSNSGKKWQGGHSEGTGLKNTRARLELMYGQKAEFSVGLNAKNNTEVSFCLPGEKDERSATRSGGG